MNYQHPRFLFRRYEVMRRVRKGRHFLEIGPGNLALAVELLTRFERGTLVDFNTTDVRQIHTELPEDKRQRLELVIADVSQYEPTDRQFDCIVACEVLEHIKADVTILHRIHHMLQPGGQLILSVPARMKYWSTDDEIVGHCRRYEKSELQQKLLAAGFSSILIVSYGFPFQNLVRLVRILLAKRQYAEKVGWDSKTQSQQSAFMVRRSGSLELVKLVLNKFTLYPLCWIASLFNRMDLSDGYLASAMKDARPGTKS